MSEAEIFTDDIGIVQVPHVDFEVDPNLPGEGQRIRDLVEMGKLVTTKLAEVAKRIIPSTLLEWSQDSTPIVDGSPVVPRGNSDIIALIESGIFQYNVDALQELVRDIRFSHPLCVSSNENASKTFVEALATSQSISIDPSLPDAIVGRPELILNLSNSQFLAECIEADFFKDRRDLLELVADKLYRSKEIRDANPAFAHGNGYWERASRKDEMPVVKALLEAGVSILIPNSVRHENSAVFER